MTRISQTRVPMWVHQADATLSQPNPVSGTPYTVLDTVKNARIIASLGQVTWTVQPTPLEMHFTIDGVAETASFVDPVTATNYSALIGTDALINLDPNLNYVAFLLEAKSVKIEVETTGGTVSNLSARVKYALRR